MCRFLNRGHHVFVEYIFVSEVRKASFTECTEKLYTITESLDFSFTRERKLIISK